MIHDFLITERYGIVPDLPLEFDAKGAIKNNRFAFHFDSQKASRYGVFPRNAKNANDIVWFDTDAHFTFHFANSWDEQTPEGHTLVTFYAVVWPKINLHFAMREHWFSEKEKQNFEKFELNLTTKQIKRTVLISQQYLEFPTMNQDFVGYKSRYCYLVNRDQSPCTDSANYYYNQVIKFDCQTDKVIGEIKLGDSMTSGEVYYQPRDCTEQQAEDSGYLMTTVHCSKSNTSQFVMWDA